VLGKRALSTGETADGTDGTVPFKWVTTTQSDIAEVAWFVRGRTLYRRVLLVKPSFDADTRTATIDLPFVPAPAGWPNAQFYANYDLSAHPVVAAGVLSYVPNTLGDLTKRECRFAHWAATFPYIPYTLGNALGLPTLCECSSPQWDTEVKNVSGTLPVMSLTSDNTLPTSTYDAWRNALPWNQLDKATGAHKIFYSGLPTTGQRIADDVILTNVIGFDVKAWDPTYQVATGVYGAYVDLGYNNAVYATDYAKPVNGRDDTVANGLSHRGHPRSGMAGNATTARVYDTYSFHYENDGTRQTETAPSTTGTTTIDAATNGFDDNADGIVDDIVYNGAPTAGENETAPPYPIPLRGIQVKIRIFEPDSRQIREVTVVQDFLPQ
jgi:hypothetical protein